MDLILRRSVLEDVLHNSRTQARRLWQKRGVLELEKVEIPTNTIAQINLSDQVAAVVTIAQHLEGHARLEAPVEVEICSSLTCLRPICHDGKADQSVRRTLLEHACKPGALGRHKAHQSSGSERVNDLRSVWRVLIRETIKEERHGTIVHTTVHIAKVPRNQADPSHWELMLANALLQIPFRRVSIKIT